VKRACTASHAQIAAKTSHTAIGRRRAVKHCPW
jgi:hypothetical protein